METSGELDVFIGCLVGGGLGVLCWGAIIAMAYFT
jgi:hypothetical protein